MKTYFVNTFDYLLIASFISFVIISGIIFTKFAPLISFLK